MSKKKKMTRLQIITLGDSKVGKTSILNRFKDGSFNTNIITTIGVDFVSKVVKVGNKEVLVRLWDTAGQERFHTVTHNSYKKSQGVLLVFDVEDKETLAGLQKWMSLLNEHGDKSIVKYLIANKIDSDKRTVMTEEGKELADKYNMKYYEVSAKTGVNITKSITDLVTEVYKARFETTKEDGFELSNKAASPIKSNCC